MTDVQPIDLDALERDARAATLDLDELFSRPWQSWEGMSGDTFTSADVTRPELELLIAAVRAAMEYRAVAYPESDDLESLDRFDGVLAVLQGR